jgi:general secretion pathway protein D
MPNQCIVLTAVALAFCGLAYGETALPSDPAVPPGWTPAPEITTPAFKVNAPAPETTAPLEDAGERQAPAADTRPRIIRGNDRVIGTPKGGGALAGAANAFRFEDAPLADVVHVILRDILKVDYLIHSPLPGSVTLATRGDVSADQAVYLLESALQANGIVLARDSRGVYHVGKPEALSGVVSAPRLAGNGILAPGTGTVIVPLQYIGATEMAAILRPLMPPTSLVRVDTVRNLLVLAGSRTQAEGWLDIVATFDVDLLKGMSVGVFPLKFASVREVEDALRMMTTGVPATPGARATAPAAAPGQPPAAAAAAGALENPMFGAIRVIPIERINSLLVVSPRAAYLDEARQWIERLDRPGVNTSESQLHIYPVKNGSARHLAEVLNGIFGETRPAAAQTPAPGVAPGLTPTMGTTGTIQGSAGTLSGVSGLGTGQAAATQSRVTGASTTSQGARIIADELNNAVLVYSLPSEFAKIEATLKRLDLPLTQVLIEASIIEVTLGNDLQYGLQWVFTDKARNGLTGTGVLSTTGGGVLGQALAGFSYTLKNSLGEVRAVLNALAEKSLVKVISSPSLMVLDNHTAGIAVGNQQPIRTGETVTTGGNVTTSIQYKDTGVNLQVTPSVSAENVVTMSINQAVTDVGQIDTATGQRSFLQRQIISKVAVRSGETLVLGGLIRDNDTSGKSGLPLLSEIPVVGALFGTQTRNISRTELLVVITPKVVRSDLDAREVGAELRERMKSFPANDMLLRP